MTEDCRLAQKNRNQTQRLTKELNVALKARAKVADVDLKFAKMDGRVEALENIVANKEEAETDKLAKAVEKKVAASLGRAKIDKTQIRNALMELLTEAATAVERVERFEADRDWAAMKIAKMPEGPEKTEARRLKALADVDIAVARKPFKPIFNLLGKK